MAAKTNKPNTNTSTDTNTTPITLVSEPVTVNVPIDQDDSLPSASTLAKYFQILYNNLLQRTHQSLSDLPHSPAIPTSVYELKAHVDSIVNRSALHEHQFPHLDNQTLDNESER